MNLKVLYREEIDEKRWNGCVHFSICAVPYAYTWYLDNICEEWLGIVYGNYKIVMPVVIGKKFCVKYSYQPFFTQQLGVFSSMPLNQKTIDSFFKAIPSDVKYVDICLNESNYFPTHTKAVARDNYLLELHHDYETIAANFSKTLRRNIKKAEKKGLYVATDLKPEDLADFYKAQLAHKIEGYALKHYYMMLRIMYRALSYQMGILLGVKNKEGKLLAVNFFINHPQRIINLFPASNAEGYASNAMAFLMHHVIRFNANQQKYLDFEGSNLQGVARFYASFGAKAVKYYHVKMNLLPKILRIFKK